MGAPYHTYSFERLDVWKNSVQLAKKILITTSRFPREEQYGLISQIRRSANAVCSNIAEGSARVSARDQARFYQIAFSSLMETLNHLILARDFDYLPDDQLIELRQEIDKIANKINALHKSRIKNISEPEIRYGQEEE